MGHRELLTQNRHRVLDASFAEGDTKSQTMRPGELTHRLDLRQQILRRTFNTTNVSIRRERRPLRRLGQERLLESEKTQVVLRFVHGKVFERKVEPRIRCGRATR